MKTKLFFFAMMVTFGAFAQIPVTDVATQASLATVNLNLSQTNMKLASTNRKLDRINNKLQTLIDKLKDNNDITDDARNIVREELDAKKNAPSYVTNSNEVQRAMELKDKIIEVYNTAKDAVENMEMITGSEKSAFIGFLANQIQVATQYFQQSRNIMNTNEIILPEERLKKVDDINGFLDEILSTIQKQTQTIKVTNSNRLTKKTLVDFSKDAD